MMPYNLNKEVKTVDVFKNLIIALIAFLGIPLVVTFIIKATGNDKIWGVAKISQFLVIFYYYGIAKAESEISKGIAGNRLPPFIKWLLFLDMPNRFTMHTVVYQSILVIATIIALILILIIKLDSDVVANRYILFGFLTVFVATIFWKKSV